MTPRQARQGDLFRSIDPPPMLPAEIQEETLALLVQLLQSMIAVIETEVAHEQDIA